MKRSIKTEEEFDEALKRFNEIFDAPAGTPEGDEAGLLANLIEAYDNKHYPIPIPAESVKVQAAGM